MTGIHRAEDACMQVAAVQRAATPRTGRSAVCLAEDAALFRSVQKFAPVGAPPGAPGLAYQAVRAQGRASGSPERKSGYVHVLPDTAAGSWREAEHTSASNTRQSVRISQSRMNTAIFLDV